MVVTPDGSAIILMIGLPGVKEADLSGQDALTEPAVASAQHRPAGGIELGDDTQTRRHGVPGAHRAPAVDHLAGVVAVGIEPVHVLADGAGVVEPEPGVDRDPAPHPEGIAHERPGGHELTA